MLAPPPPAWRSGLDAQELAMLELTEASAAFCQKAVADDQREIERWCSSFAAPREWLRCKRDSTPCLDVDERCAHAKTQKTKDDCGKLLEVARELAGSLEQRARARAQKLTP